MFYCEVILIIFAPEEAEIFKDYLSFLMNYFIKKNRNAND
jgi:hypothetical protein